MATAFTFVPETHTYLVGDRVVPSVTQILNRVGLVCYDHIPREILDRKAEIGTAAHAAAHYHDEGDLNWDSLDPEVAPYVSAWVKFRNETRFEPRLVEQRGIAEHNGMQYGYTLDREGVLLGKETLIEIKCTAGIEISWGPQTAAYELALREAGRARRRVAVWLKPNATYQLVPYSDPNDYKAWQWALGLESWRLSKGGGYGYGSH